MVNSASSDQLPVRGARIGAGLAAAVRWSIPATGSVLAPELSTGFAPASTDAAVEETRS